MYMYIPTDDPSNWPCCRQSPQALRATAPAPTMEHRFVAK